MLPINLKQVFYLHVSGLITIGESKLAMDCTPAISPCAFPCDINDSDQENDIFFPYN